jgi:hypothetical protein
MGHPEKSFRQARLHGHDARHLHANSWRPQGKHAGSPSRKARASSSGGVSLLTSVALHKPARARRKDGPDERCAEASKARREPS